MVGASPVGTGGGFGVTLFLLAKSLMDAAQSDWGGFWKNDDRTTCGLIGSRRNLVEKRLSYVFI